MFLPSHFTANVFLPDLRQRRADNGKKMNGRNMAIKHLAENDVFSSFFCQCFFFQASSRDMRTTAEI
jgi:hypothetical protein